MTPTVSPTLLQGRPPPCAAPRPRPQSRPRHCQPAPERHSGPWRTKETWRYEGGGGGGERGMERDSGRTLELMWRRRRWRRTVGMGGGGGGGMWRVSLVLPVLVSLQATVTGAFEERSLDFDLRFTSDHYNATVPENALGNTPVVSDDMMGIFLARPVLNMRYKIVEGDPYDFFKAKARVVGNFCFLELSVRTNTKQVLNRESRDLYKLKVKAQHRRHDRSKVDLDGVVASVWVTITDMNDLSPFFLHPESYNVRLSEDTALHTSVARVQAEDPDDGLNGQVYYSFSDDTRVFAIHPTSGVVTLTRPLRYLEQAHYDLTVVAQDRSPQRKGRPSKARLSIDVTEINVFEPQIRVTHLQEPVSHAHLSVVAIVNVMDGDKGLSGEVHSLEIVEGDPERVFRILPGSGANEFNLAALSTLDWSDIPLGFNLTLKATDRGSRPRFSYKLVSVGVSTRIEQEPIFLQKDYEVSVSEAAPVNTTLLRVSASLPGEQRGVAFTIMAGNEGGEFYLDPSSGVLSLAKLVDAENRNSYSLSIAATTTAIRRTRQQASAKVIVRVADANDNDPIIVAPQGIVRLDEHQPVGTWVTKVRAQDYDSGVNGYVSYSLANAEEVPFAIDHFSGELRTTRTLDYELEQRVWYLRVRASDWGSPYRRQTEKIIKIHVEDVNDNRPQFERVSCTGYIYRSAPAGTEIFTLSAVDFDSINIISYRIVSGNEDRCFSLDSNSGVLSLICDLEDLRASERVLNVTATDGQHFADTMSIRLQLMKRQGSIGDTLPAAVNCREMGVAQRLAQQINRSKKVNADNIDVRLLFPPPDRQQNLHAPVLRQFPREVRLRENSEPGTVVLQVNAHDRDHGYNGHLTYAISGGNTGSVFLMNTDTGDITVAGLLDREHVDRYTLNVTVYDLGIPQRAVSKEVVIILVDVNDNAPKFDKIAYSFFLPENVANGTSIYQLRATDRDEGPNGAVAYSLATDTKDFLLDSVTGILTVSRPLDRERHEVYELRALASDAGTDFALTSHTYVTIQVLDINDCAPEFPGGPRLVRVPEDLPLGALVTLVSATDQDSTQIFYTLMEGHEDVFSLDPETGALRLAAPLDYERRPAYNVTVRATDDGSPALSALTHVIVQVVDVNENVHSPVFGHDVLMANVSEGSPPHTHVLTVTALDADLAPADAAVSYSLVGAEGQGIFYIDQKGGLHTMVWLDRETRANYWVTVRAQDSGTVPRHSHVHVYIEVVDVNDNRPLSSWPVYWPGVAENSTANTPVVTVDASDRDPDTKLTYSITAGNPQSLFTIDPNTGEIRTTVRRLDREQQAEHGLEVTVTDNGNPPLSSTTIVIVNVLDENDHDPEFLERPYKFSVPLMGRTVPVKGVEGALDDQEGLLVGQVVAKDEDDGDNGDVTYSIDTKEWQGIFKIDSKTGVIFAMEPLEPQHEYELTVFAVDNGRPQRSSTSLVLISTVSVPTSSPHAPVLQGGTSTIEANVLESDPIGHHVMIIEAKDEDGDELWFDIVAGNEGQVFTLGRSTGAVLLAGTLDAETKEKYNLTVTVTDGVHITYCQLLITVMDVNDNRPTFSQPIYEVELSENTNPGTTVFVLHASDLDSDQHLTFSLVNTAHVASSSKFRINPTTGDVVLFEALDRELQEEHILTVGVKDRITPTKSNYARLIFRVRDYNDHVPQFLASTYNGTVLETSPLGSSIVQVMAVDRDKGINGQVTYSIVSGNIGGVFSLNSMTGLVTLTRPVERQVMPEYWLAIRGSDGGSPPRHSHVNVNILVKMAQGAPPRFLRSEYVLEVSENARVGQYLCTLEVESHLGVVYSLFGDPGRSLPFNLNPASGTISLDAPLDYEEQKSYNISVVATSMSGLESMCLVIINILDENDNPPYFTQENYQGHISEAASFNSVVLMENNSPLVITAKDKDAEQNANLVFTILDQEARTFFAIDSSTGAIRTIAALDHEVVSEVQFGVSVHDSGRPRMIAPTTATVTISITDINDVPPRFLQQEYNTTLLIPTYKDVSVVQLNATDLDYDPKIGLTFAIAAGNEDDKFSINQRTGLVTVKQAKNLSSYYRLKVTVSDGQFASSTTVHISVQGVPTSRLRFSQEKYFASILENSTKVHTVVMVQVLGSELNEHLHFKILNPSPMFTIGTTSGVIMTAGIEFDREEQDNYLIIVEARSMTSGVRVAHTKVHVVVTDMNDNAPIFVNTPYYAVVPIDSRKGKVVFKVQATDFDAGKNKEVRYELHRGNGELFGVNRTTGAIVLRQSLEGLEPEYQLIISAYDGGDEPLYSQVTVRLKVVDRSQPIFENQFYSAVVKENVELYTPVITITATSELNHKLIYTIVSGNSNEQFAMDFESGLIRVQDQLDFEGINNHQLTVRATDSYSGKWAEVVVSIRVTDVNDHPPKFENLFYNVTVSEATSIATPILSVSTTDQDTTKNAGVSYHVEALNGSNSEHFYMAGSSGVLILKKGLDREWESVHRIVVVATDTGTPPLSSTAHVLVTVLDMNDNPPTFEQPSYRCVVTEGAARGHFVTMVTASDLDTSDVGKLTFNIQDGNDHQAFVIDPETGIVTVWNSQKLVEANSHLLNVSVSDGVFTSYTHLAITIVPVNAHSPTFRLARYEAHLPEDASVGTRVTTVSATDEDSGHFGEITYHFVGDEAQKFFRMNENSGEIWTSTEFDREVRSKFEYTVMAVDIGGRTGFTSLHVVLKDVNDNSPVFSRPIYLGVIPTNATTGSQVLKVSANDADAGNNGLVLYKIHESTGSDITRSFLVDRTTGLITLRKPASQLGSQMYEFFVVAQDYESGGLHSSVSVVLSVVESSTMLPVFLSASYALTVMEDSKPGTIIGSVQARYEEGELEYKLEWSPQDITPPVTVLATGELQLSSLLDRESMPRFTIFVTAQSADDSDIFASTQVLIEVLDVNDESPVFESEKYYVSIAENTPSGSNVIKVQAHDKDSGSNAELRYAIVEKPPLEDVPLFTLDPYSGWLSLNQELDAETKSKYELEIVAKDSGSPQQNSSATIIIEVIDYNDNPPTFSRRNYKASVGEDALPGTVVVQLEVDDLDLGTAPVIDNGGVGGGEMGIEYHLTQGNELQHFDIRRSGQIYVTKELDRESVDRYSLEIIASDGFFVAKARVDIQVLDVNDNGPLCTTPYYHHTISESADPETLLLQVSASDLDLLSQPAFFLTGAGSNKFALDRASGSLQILKPLDREEQAFFSLTATVRDEENSDWSCSCRIEIEVTDVNDNAPIFSQDSYSVNVPENAPENILLLKIHASDPDQGKNRRVTYSLEGSDIFVMDRQSGIMAVTKSLDREEQAMYNLTVTATDHGVPQISSKTNVLVLVSDVNDNPPEFASHTHYVTISESASLGSDIVRVLATSRDSGKNAEITYSIIGGNEHRKFAIHPKKGLVSVMDHLDYERAHSYQLTVQATDGGHPPLSNHATVNVTVTDINDNEPIFIQNSYSAIVNEAAIIGERLIQVVATDLDSLDNGRISYSIATGDPLHQFRVDKATGWVSVAAPLDREKTSTYGMEVIAIDHGIPQRSGAVLVHIEVSDANDNAPEFIKTNHTTYIQEDKPVNFLVFKFQVTDGDDNSAGNAGPFTFELRSGNEEAAFRITQEGDLRTATRFNHKIKDLYRLQIRVYDNGRPPHFSETWINVKIIEESQYPPQVFPLRVTVAVLGGQFQGGSLGIVKASDEDLYDTLSFAMEFDGHSITSRYFSIDTQSGMLSARDGLDSGKYIVNISVTDGKFLVHSQATVEVLDVSDEMVDNAIIIQLGGATPEKFLLSYWKNFLRGVRKIMKVRPEDVIILSLREISQRSRRDSSKRQKKKKQSNPLSDAEADFEVLFAVRKSPTAFYPREIVRKKVSSDRRWLESELTGLYVVGVVENECTSESCINGRCEEQVTLDDEEVLSIITETTSFVSLRHHHEGVCRCPQGFSGPRCGTIINRCASKPCPSYKKCVPDGSMYGYVCLCPEGMMGHDCSMNKSECIGREHTPECYMPVSPLAFMGKSYAQYSLHHPIERHFSFSLWFRTLHPAGNLFFAAGRIDYSILELEGGYVRYRWDLGSGEGVVAVASNRVNDGRWHHVLIERFGSTAEVMLDGKIHATGSSPGSSDLLNLESPHLYLGAELRPWAGAQDPRKGLVGCLDDPRVDNIPLPLSLSAGNAVSSLTRLAHVNYECQMELPLPGVCGAHPCHNGGTCEEHRDSFVCQCHPRFRGSRCEFDSDPCASSPCLNNGNCINTNNTYRCDCPPHISGPRCQSVYCNPNPCHNNGLCEEGISGPICKCQGFTGPYCKIDINECATNPCLNGGTCVNTFGSFRCLCHGNSTGLYCSVHESPIIGITLEEIIYIVVGIVLIITLGLIIVLAIHCKEKRAARRRQLLEQTNHVILKPKNTDNHHHHNLYKRNSKMSNLEASQNPHATSTTTTSTRPDHLLAYPNSPGEPVYMPLNNFDTIRSYGSAGDELENLPQHSKDFVQNIAKPSSYNNHHYAPVGTNPLGTPRGSLLGSPGSAGDADSLHKPWKDALGHNLKDAYYESNKIQNDVKFRQGEYLSLKKLGGGVGTGVGGGGGVGIVGGGGGGGVVVRGGGDLRSEGMNSSTSQRDDSSVRSGTSVDDLPVEGPVDPGRDMETLPADELVSDCGTDFDLESRPDLDTSHLLDQTDPGAESDTSLFSPQPQRYESHPNQYLPCIQLGSETETDDERGKLLNTHHHTDDLPPPLRLQPFSPYRVPSLQKSSPNVPTMATISNTAQISSPPLLANGTATGASGLPLGLGKENNRRYDVTKRFSEFGGDMSVISGMEEEEGASLWGATSNTSTSDLDNLCDIEDSEVNSEFENDEKIKE
ncbi:FAT atypical cadherin kugelei isoform X2 [Oratosquilla oratoria]|uniref:FAT atypical cadherin kugelei isoform X2 n=1 Tax=Oratosquilla oratoria TaxID=337810 RepID=UPI003F75C2AA